MPDEFDLIAAIRRQVQASEAVPLGIGDDAAVIRHGKAEVLVAADTILEGVHFKIPEHPPELIGRKALAVNLSDIAAMAGKPKTAFVSLTLRRELGASYAEELMRGLLNLANEFGVTIAGGDTNIWDGPLTVGVTVTGDPTGNGPVTRGGAKPGDTIYVTGPLGGSYESGRHLTFSPHVQEAISLHEKHHLTAMIDISDGLLSDLGHICEQSGVGAELNAEQVPIQTGATLEAALTEGEDFELLFTSQDTLEEPGIILIGKIISGSSVEVKGIDPEKLNFNKPGYRHSF
ncbi:thiamine-phosphate kinase [Calycomorphotria hydatis]|uniref:Thiamine-monophosphate kinase n=1 Tax=Calycomorphotria hydatis TaxID=2528027 RepID=A0A517T724_9PLAN|nr:thiamine-phosphate kinase [Calycomorphotria hydatis]QDT64172.1 Thiamine-monophosphate kinase [Calycomorphotria hydatis]